MDIFLLKSAACLAICYAFYKLVLERENMHQVKRYYLLGSVLASFTIPLITFTKYVEVQTTLIPVTSSEFITEFPTEIGVAPNYWPMILWTVYLLGVVFFSLKFGRNLYAMIQKIRKNPWYKNDSIFHVLLKSPTTPHTFFSYIFLNKRKYEAREIPEEVLLHEETHAKQLHSLDIIVMELLQIVFWFNPFLYFFKHSIKLNHEFLADSAVLKNGVETANYQTILLAFSSNADAPELANSINYSFIKKRFTVMKKSSSKRTIWLRSLVLLPLLAALIYGFSTTQLAVVESTPFSEETIEKATTTIPTARSIEIEIEANGTYLVEGVSATKKTLAQTVGKLHQDLTPAVRNQMMNIHIMKPKDPSKEEVQFIFDTLKDYGFYRLVAGNQEVVRGKGNTPMKSEPNEIAKSKVSWEKEYAKEYNEGAKRNGELSIVITVNLSKIMVNGKFVTLENFAKEIDRVTKKWTSTDFNDAHPSVLITSTPNSFLKKLDAEFRKTNYYKENGRQSIIPTSPPPPPPPVEVIKGVNDGDRNIPPPPPPPAPLDHVIAMAKKGAIFYYEGKKVTSDKAIQLLKENQDLNIQSTRNSSNKPVVKITKAPIQLKKGKSVAFETGNVPSSDGNEQLFYVRTGDKVTYYNRYGNTVNLAGKPVSSNNSSPFVYDGKTISPMKAQELLQQNRGLSTSTKKNKNGSYTLFLNSGTNNASKYNHNNNSNENINKNNVGNTDPNAFINLEEVIQKGATFFYNDNLISSEIARNLAKDPLAISRTHQITRNNGKSIIYFYKDTESGISNGPMQDPKVILLNTINTGDTFFLKGKQISKKEALQLWAEKPSMLIRTVNGKDGSTEVHLNDDKC